MNIRELNDEQNAVLHELMTMEMPGTTYSWYQDVMYKVFKVIFTELEILFALHKLRTTEDLSNIFKIDAQPYLQDLFV
jgi:hypothetical protein